MLTEKEIQKWMLEDGGAILYDNKNPGVFTGYVIFTPERAKAALENNTHNRRVNQMSINVLADTMSRGFWDPNVSKINFDENMILSDGQHRLITAGKTGTTIRTLVTVGLTPQAQTVTDRRGNRQLGDDLEMNHVQNARRAAALTRICCYLEDGASVSQMINWNDRTTGKFSDRALLDYYTANKDRISRYCSLSQSVYKRVHELKVPGKVINILTVAFDQVNETDAWTFWKRLGGGVYETETDPIRLLRIRLVNNANSTTNKLTKHIVAALIIKAWNAFERGEMVKQLKYTAGGTRPEPFPEIYNPYAMEEGGEADGDIAGGGQ